MSVETTENEVEVKDTKKKEIEVLQASVVGLSAKWLMAAEAKKMEQYC